MIISFKIYLALTAFVISCIYHFLLKHLSPKLGWKARELNGQGYFLQFKKSKDRATLTLFIFVFKSPYIFSITKEKESNRFFKRSRFFKEIQTGDSAFDEKFYLACDQPEFGQYMSQDLKIRKSVQSLFEQRCESINFTAKTATFTIRGDASTKINLIQECMDVLDKFEKIPAAQEKFFADRFAKRVIFFQSILWSIVAYALINAIEFYFTMSQDLYVIPGPMLIQSAVMTFALYVLLIGSISVFLKGSSKSHFLITRNALIFIFCIPITGLAIINDLNIGLDHGITEIKQFTVQNMLPSPAEKKNVINQLTRYNRIMQFTNKDSFSLKLWDGKKQIHLFVSGQVYNAIQAQGQINVEISPGFLGHEWYKSFNSAQ